MGARTLMTVEEFAQLRTSETEDYELVEGELIPLSSGTPRHSKIRRKLQRLLEDYFNGNAVGEPFDEVDCLTGENTVRRPDLSIFLGERLQQIDLNKIPVQFAPDIAVEVLSLSERAVDMHRKVREYLSGRTEEVWIFDHENAEVFMHTRNGIRVLVENDVLESVLLPGFRACISEILA